VGRPTGGELAFRVVEDYASTARLVEALADEYHFQAIYIWQPTVYSTTKPLAAYEKYLMGEIDADPYQATLKAVHTLITQSIDSAMADVAPQRFLNLSALFASDTAARFVDTIGHTTEEANGPIVEAMLPALKSALSHQASLHRRP